MEYLIKFAEYRVKMVEYRVKMVEYQGKTTDISYLQRPKPSLSANYKTSVLTDDNANTS